MARHLKTRTRDHYNLEKILGLALFVSLGLHIVASWFLLYVVPAWESDRRDNKDVIVVQLMGAMSPPAPAAPPLPVDPATSLPDVVETPPPAETAPQPAPPEAEPLITAPEAKSIPIAPPEVKEPVLERKEAPPKIKPPPKKVEKPAPNPTKPRTHSLDTEINRRLEQIKRKTEAEKVDEAIEQRVMNIAKSQGGGQGESRESYGGASTGERLDPVRASYYRLIQDRVSSNWIPPAGALAGNLSATFQIRIEPNGTVSAAGLRVSSGNPEYDDSVAQAVRRSSPFPPLPPVFGGQADNLALRFRIQDMRQAG